MTFPSIDPLSTAPNRSDPVTFRSRMDVTLGELLGFVTQTNAAGVYIEAAAAAAAQSVIDAATEVGLAADEVALAAAQKDLAAAQKDLAVIQADNALIYATAAAATANATEWVSGASYTVIISNVISAVDFGTYRAITTHTGVATDPSADATNWVLISADGVAYAPLAGAVTLTGGFGSTEEPLGTITSGTVTPEVDAANEENYKVLTNNGAFTLAPPSTSSACGIRIHVINGASAGAITTSGFDKVFDPDGYATTNAKEYFFWIDHNSTRDVLTIREIV